MNDKSAAGIMNHDLDLTILYRGPLSSCNYDCHYCPFAKRHETAAELRGDRDALIRFRNWVETRGDDRFSILFTPWGEGLVRRWYRESFARLSNLNCVRKVAIQTNLSGDLEWLDKCDRSSVGLWCTWHPSQSTLDDFLAQCHKLDALQIRYSVGLVGLREYRNAATELRDRLSPDVYLWVNAFKGETEYYREEDIRHWEAIDPLFRVNNTRHPSLGRNCRAGETVISVDGDGTIRRCHFIKTPIGNLYDANFEAALRERRCSNQTCSCHIGYVHMHDLNLYDVFGEGVLERIPGEPIWRSPVERDSAERDSAERDSAERDSAERDSAAGAYSQTRP